MKIPHSNCWYFYYSGAWGRKIPHGECWCFYYSVHWAKIPRGNCWRFYHFGVCQNYSAQSPTHKKLSAR